MNRLTFRQVDTRIGTPIYTALTLELGYDPLARRDVLPADRISLELSWALRTSRTVRQ